MGLSINMNRKMQELANMRFEQTWDIPNAKLIKKLYSLDGEDYYCLKKGFCFQNSKDIRSRSTELSVYEWEGNEIFISYPDMSYVVAKSMMTIKQLANQMLNQFSGISFDIFISFDYEDVELPPSATIRFHKIREAYHIITLDQLEEYDQPVGLCQVNI